MFPHIGVAILAQTLIVKAIDLGDLSCLMVATQNGNSAGVADLIQAKGVGEGMCSVSCDNHLTPNNKVI